MDSTEYSTADLQKKLMDYLSRRDHSEDELRKKLSQKYPDEAIDIAIKIAYEKKWLLEPSQLSQKTALSLQKKGKGSLYIAKYLYEKGLPEVSFDSEQELNNAIELINKRLAEEKNHEKITRFLRNRGFTFEIIQKTIDNLT